MALFFDAAPAGPRGMSLALLRAFRGRRMAICNTLNIKSFYPLVMQFTSAWPTKRQDSPLARQLR
jgi:hypothetical protein